MSKIAKHVDIFLSLLDGMSGMECTEILANVVARYIVLGAKKEDRENLTKIFYAYVDDVVSKLEKLGYDEFQRRAEHH